MIVPRKCKYTCDSKADSSLDIQFRLLRSDATASLARGIKAVLKDLDAEDYENTQSESSVVSCGHQLISVAHRVRTGGGRFIASSDSSDAV